jgi:hypothetical protein
MAQARRKLIGPSRKMWRSIFREVRRVAERF